MTPRVGHNRGFVLVLVLGAIALMASLVVGLNLHTRAAVRTGATWRNRQQALNNAYSGLAIAMSRWSDPNAVPHADETVTLDQGQCSFTVIPESGRLNVNTLLNNQDKPVPERIEQWMRLIDSLNREPEHPAIDYDLIAALIDWTDKDDKITNLTTIPTKPSGSERYSVGPMSRSCPSRPVQDISELRWLPGMNAAIYNRLETEVHCGLENRIDLNYASETVLQALSSHIDPVLARIVVQRRQVAPYNSMEELSHLPGMSTAAFEDLSRWAEVNLKSPQAQIKASGVFNGIQCDLIAQIQRNSTTGSVDVLHIKEI